MTINNFFFQGDDHTTAQTFLIVMAALTPLLAPLVCLCQFYTRKYASRATTTLYETDNTDTILTGCGWCCLLAGMSCIAAFLATDGNSHAATSDAFQQHDWYTYYGLMRWTNVTIRLDTFRASCTDPSSRTHCGRHAEKHYQHPNCCLYHSLVPELHLQFGYEWACAAADAAADDKNEVERLCHTQVPLQACATIIVCNNDLSSNCSDEEKEASQYLAIMDCVRQQQQRHSTSNQTTTATTSNNKTMNVFDEVALSNDSSTVLVVAPNPDQEPTWLAYGNCHTCQAQISLPKATLPQQQQQQQQVLRTRHHHNDHYKLQKVGRILSFLGVASVALGLYITLTYSLYLMGKRQQQGQQQSGRGGRSNSSSSHHHYYRQHQVVPVAKKCQLIVLDESDHCCVNDNNDDNNNNNDDDDIQRVAGVLPASVLVTTTTTTSNEMYSSSSSKQLQDGTI